ncbi:MAG: hypothetical protein M1832_004538 [Thelocarpon impressellum]|nr:MAG: hypothetical protein M1832_004538 [Thelocarpon impressellum]
MLGALLGRGLHGVGPGHLPPDPLFYSLLAAFIAVGMYNALEIHVQVFSVFQQRKGLYFWSILTTAWGIIVLAVGNIALKMFTPGVNFAFYTTLIVVGWWMVVLGQAMVLYSRLHLVVRSPTIMRAVLVMIAVVFFGLAVPTGMATYGSNSNKSEYWLPIFNRIERVQLVGIELEETIISGIYIWATVKILRPSFNVRTKRVMWSLINVNAFVVALDVVMIATEFASYYNLEAALKPVLYSIKLKVEFAVLNQLMAIAKGGISSHGYDGYDTADPRAFNDGKTAQGLWSLQSDSRWIPSYPFRQRRKDDSTERGISDSARPSVDDARPPNSQQLPPRPRKDVRFEMPEKEMKGDLGGLRISRTSNHARDQNTRECGSARPPSTITEAAEPATGSPDDSWLELDAHCGPTAKSNDTLVEKPPAPATPSSPKQRLDLDPWDDVIPASPNSPRIARTGAGADPYTSPRNTRAPGRWLHVGGQRWEADTSTSTDSDDTFSGSSPRGRDDAEAGADDDERQRKPGLLSRRARSASVRAFGRGGALNEVADDVVGLSLFSDEEGRERRRRAEGGAEPVP